MVVRALLALGLLGTLGFTAGADTIYLKNKQKIEGSIDTTRSDERVVFIRTSRGLTRINRSRIERIERRENITEDERSGDLAAQEDNFDQALIHYLRGYRFQPDDEVLENKIEDMRARIKERVEKRFDSDFRRIDAAAGELEFETAIQLGLELLEGVEEESAQRRCREKIGEVYLLQARDFQNAVNYPRSEQAYRKSIEFNSAGAVARLELATLVGGYPTREAEAFELYGEGIALADGDPTLVDPNDLLRYRYQYGRLHLKGGHYTEAGSILWRVSQDDKQRRFNRATELILEAYQAIRRQLTADRDQYEEPYRILNSIVEQNPNESGAHFLLGEIYHDQEQWAAAIPLLESAERNMILIGRTDRVSDARFYLAICYRKLTQDSEAEEKLLQVIRDQPFRYEALCELGELYLDALAYDKALELFERGIEIAASNYRHYLGAGRALKETKQYPRALEQYEALIELRDDHPDYLFEMAEIQMAMNNYREARNTYFRVVDLLEDEEAAGSRTEEEKQQVNDVLGQVYSQLGLTSIAQRNYNQAVEQFDRALDYVPNFAKAYDGKGQANRELGVLDKAEEFFALAIAADPDNPEFLLNLGVLFHRFKQERETALTYYYAYYERGGTAPEVREWIRECGGSLSATPSS